MAHCLRPWKDEYQLLCSIDSVSGEMKSISPFQVPRQCDLDNQTATSIQSHFKVIESISDYQESKAYRTRLSGAVSSLWSVEANCSALDTAKVNSKDVFGYYALHFTKSRVVVSGCTLNMLTLTREAERAVRCGKFRDLYGDMIVVGYITGGEAEAVLRVTSFKEDRRDSILKALRVALQDNASSSSCNGSIEAVVNGAINAAISIAAAPAVPGGGAAEYGRGQDDMQALQDATTTLLSRRTGVTHQDQLHNPNNFPQLLRQLTKAAENTGVKISALCYRVELFNQVPQDVLGFARSVVDENVRTLQKQFAQVQFVYNSCEAHLAPSAAGCMPTTILRETRKLQTDAHAAMQRFAQFKGYRDVGQLSAQDSARTIGSQLFQHFDELREKMRAAEDKTKAQQMLAPNWKACAHEQTKEVTSDYLDASRPGLWGTSPQSEAPTPQPATYCDGVLRGLLLAGRNFPTGRVMATQLYIVVKLDGKTLTSPTIATIRNNSVFLWSFKFQLDVSAKLLTEDASLVLEVYDKNTLVPDKYLGTVTVKLRQACGAAAKLGDSSLRAAIADGDRSKPNWYPVEKVDSGKYKSRGELQLALQFNRNPASSPLGLQAASYELSSRSFSSCGGTSGKATESWTRNPQPTSSDAPVVGYPAIPTHSNILGMPLPGVPAPVAVTVWQHDWPHACSAAGQQQKQQPQEWMPPSGSFSCAGLPGPQQARGLQQVRSFDLSKEGLNALDETYSSSDDDDESGQGREVEVEAKSRSTLGAPCPASEHIFGGSYNGGAKAALSTAHSARRGNRVMSAPNVSNSYASAVGGRGACPEALDGLMPQRPRQTSEGSELREDALLRSQQWRDAAGVTQELEPMKQTKRTRRAGFVGLLVRLTMTGAVLGSAGAAVVVGRNRFGVDLVAESRRLAIEYGTIAQRASVTWSRQGGSAVRAWTSKLVEKVRRRSKVDGCWPAGNALDTPPSLPPSLEPATREQ